MEYIEEVRKFVEAECRKESSHYGPEPYKFHFVPMVHYAQELAKRLGGDLEIVTLAGWLHDIGSIAEGRKDHHLSGARIAKEKLEELGYPEEKIGRVVKCIKNHRGSLENKRESLEEKIIAEADALSNFDNVSGIFKAAYIYEHLDQGEAKEAVKRKLENKYQKLHFAESKELIRPKYEAAMLLLS